MKDMKRLLGMRIKELRKGIGFSQEELAERTGISSKYLSRIEMGQHFPSIDTLIRLADALNVELKDFFEFVHEVPSCRELKEILNNLVEGMDEDRLRLVVKVVKAMAR